MWMLCVWWVLLGTLGAGSAQLVLHSIPFLEIKYYNGPKIILPCVVTNLKENSRFSMFVEWQFQGNKFFIYDGVTDSITKNNSFNTATFLNRSVVPYGIASLVMSTKQALLGNYTCAVTELNREGRTTFELRESSGSAQLVLHSIPFLEIKYYNGPKIILPCVVTNLKENNRFSMFVEWQFQGKNFFLYDGVTDSITKNNSFNTATFLNRSVVPYGIASLVMSTKQALLGNYTCAVTELNREGRTTFELRESSGSAQLVLHSIPFLEKKQCNGDEIILPCVVTNLKENSSLSMFVKWQFQGNQFFLYDGVTDNVAKNNSFDTATFLNRSMVPYGIVSLVISTKQALPGNYTCEVTEVNREGRTKFELRVQSSTYFIEAGVSLNGLQKMVEDKKTWRNIVRGVAMGRTRLRN